MTKRLARAGRNFHPHSSLCRMPCINLESLQQFVTLSTVYDVARLNPPPSGTLDLIKRIKNESNSGNRTDARITTERNEFIQESFGKDLTQSPLFDNLKVEAYARRDKSLEVIE